MVRRLLVTKLLEAVIQNHLSNAHPLSLSLAMTEEVYSSSGKVKNCCPSPQGSPLQKQLTGKKNYRTLESSGCTENNRSTSLTIP